jgi:hypothetical protein
MKWLSKLLGRPGKPQADAAARDNQVLEEQYAAEAARPQSEQAPTSEPREPSDPEPIEPGGSDQQATP